jgi:glycosyltransferase involved in cell wall biosynthesis
VEKMWFRLGQEFALQGHEVTHISRRYENLALAGNIKGVSHLRVRGYDQPSSLLKLKYLDFLYSRRACKAASLNSDVVITNTFWSPLLLPKSLKSRAYADIQRMPKGQSRLYTKAGRLRANSAPVAAAIRRELPVRQANRVSMIPNPLPFDPPPILDIAAKEKKILYCGRVHPEKGLDLLIPAARGLSSDWTVEVVGPWETSQGGGGSTYLDHLKTLAHGLPVTFHGPEFDMERLSAHYRRASIFAYPSVAEKGETFGLAPLEAMAWGGVPVVSSLACFEDFIQPQVNGLVFNHRSSDAISQFAAAMTLLINDDAMRQRMTKEAARVGQTHSPSHIGKLFLADFERMCSEQSLIS